MSRLPSAFNPNDHEEMGSFEALPVGDYHAVITDSDKKESNRTPGNYYWKLEFTIKDGKYDGRKVWTNLNLINKNPDAVEIAQRELTSICNATNTGPIESTEELHGKHVMITLKVDPATPKYPESNSISGYKPVPGMAQPPKNQDDSDDASADASDDEPMPWDD